MKNFIKFVILSCLIMGATACFHKDDESKTFIYYGGASNVDAIISIDDRDFARRAYFRCDDCIKDYTNRYMEDGIWLWDQKTCRTEGESESLYCLHDILMDDFDVETESHAFSDGGCDFVVPKVGEPEFPDSQKLQACEINEDVSDTALYCSKLYVALDNEDNCSFDEIDESL